MNTMVFEIVGTVPIASDDFSNHLIANEERLIVNDGLGEVVVCMMSKIGKGIKK